MPLGDEVSPAYFIYGFLAWTYIVGQMPNEKDRMMVRRIIVGPQGKPYFASGSDWREWSEEVEGHIPEEVSNHFFGPVNR